MICKNCGNYMPEGSVICDECGQLLKQPQNAGGKDMPRVSESLRQGRSMPGYMSGAGAETAETPKAGQLKRQRRQSADRLERFSGDAGRPNVHSGVPGRNTTAMRHVKKSSIRTYKSYTSHFNITYFCLIIVTVLILLALGTFAYLRWTDAGQVIMARRGQEASPQAYWTIGDEYFDAGYIGKAIDAYQTAFYADKDKLESKTLSASERHLPSVLNLATCFEIEERDADAETLYLYYIDTLSPTTDEGYRNLIRLYESNNRVNDAIAVMEKGASKTGLSVFTEMRSKTLPATPTCTLTAGRFNDDQTFYISSSQGYSIYYYIGSSGEDITFQDAKPYSGESITINEGVWVVKAWCVNGELVSDGLTVTFTISYDSPKVPTSSLASGVYQQRQRVRIKPGEGDPNVVIYYTITGRNPSPESPVYSEDIPIILTGGDYTLKCLSVNWRAKVSNTKSYTYKVKAGSQKAMLGNGKDEDFDGVQINKTPMDTVNQKYGEPQSSETASDEGQGSTPVTVSKYPFGEMRFINHEGSPVLYYIYTDSSSLVGPRNTKVGMDKDSVIALFRDCGQLENYKGDRDLYYNSDQAKEGYLTKNGDGDYTLMYSYEPDSGYVAKLIYTIKNDKVTEILMTCYPKVTN
ncbi:MAG: chitobiase/beta-hexosaminidase C-terminal domain-containing protein [Eubacteriales bacterium]|nr:chitobiase/beta-hexosaminidase C-terminal domain-containing protein [Eubacteriales bacterium]MDD3882515.1 chitobiase/beta-hexosaminidase C-terminal domain-containing protein [Eubacteriales bacterium]MDD4512815.1 chitobiase/beta-hexosaminidase C-terminal domain-containing protein [Eubacteriales bacterium]